MEWLAAGAGLVVGSWLLVLLGRRSNAADRTAGFSIRIGIAAVAAIAGCAALMIGPWRAGLDPTTHVYPAIVCTLTIWTVLHVGVGVVMLLYLLARRWAGRLTAAYDIDMHNVVLYWHFTTFAAVVTALVVVGFPLVAR